MTGTAFSFFDIILILLILISAFYFFNKYVEQRYVKLPPGPVGLPLVGYLPFLGDLPFKAFKELSLKYGNIFGLYMGRSYVVVLNNYESVKDAFSNPVILDRPPKFFDFHPGGLGFVASNGKEWIEERRYVMRVIKDIGMGKTRWEDDLDAEIESFLKSISEFDGKPVDLHDYLSHSVSNNMTSMVLGRRIPTGDSQIKMINEAVDGLSALGQAGAVTFFPDLMKFLAKTGFSKLRIPYNNMKKLYDFMRKEVELRKSNFENSEELVFIDGYLKLMKSLEEKNEESNFSVNSLIANAQAMIHAGSETIRTSLLWLFVSMASFPEVQKNCRDEIRGVLGKDGKCRWSDAKKLPYAYATVMEGQRWRTVSPLGLSHRAREDTKIEDFHIPKGAFVISNAWALHNDPKYWPEPEKFEPERFLLEDGTLNKKKPESYVPFSLGRRNCPGESIAMMEIFRYLVSILQKYEILPLEDHLPVLEGEVGLTFSPYRQELRFVPRDMDMTILLLEIILFSLITLIALSYFNKYVKSNNKKLPPGPSGIPLLGYLPFLGDLPFKTFKQLSQKYGNVFGIYMGRSFAVILNDFESVKDAFSNPAILDRPPKFFDFHPGGLGFVSTNGDAWVEERRYVMKIIKDIGMGKSRWEEDLEAEIGDFLKNLSQLQGEPTDIRDLLSHSISNNMTSLVLGKRIPLHDAQTTTINNAVNALSALGQSGAVLFFPDLMKFLARTGLSKLSVQYYSMKKLNDFMRNEVSSRKKIFEMTDETVFIDGYLRQMKLLKEKNIKSCFTEENLTANAQALIQAGSETTRTSLLWLFFAMASNLGVQNKCHQEIDNVLGTDGKCQWSNARNLPFTYATVMEGQRWRTVSPINLARMANEDTTIGDFHIPKGTLIFSHMWALHNDTKYWQDPENFMPERFLSKDGSLSKTKPESYIPFSIGRRNCPGESIAMMEIFRYFASVLQKFDILPEDSHPPDLEGKLEITYTPRRQKLKFIARN
nr:uncharacterized protein LOC107452943 [Parasteatoda tepidariorum]